MSRSDIATPGGVARRAPGRGLPRPEAWRWRRASGAACCVSIEKAGRIYAKHADFDYDALGTHSGAHLAVVIYATLAAAYDRRAHIIEYGIGAHQAKALRGCQPRTVTSYLLTDRPHVRDTFTAAAAVSTPRRQAEYGSPSQPPVPRPGVLFA